MKRLVLLFFFAFVVVLSACGRINVDIGYDGVSFPVAEECGEPAQISENGGEVEYVEPLGSRLTQEQELFLEDLDYMLYVLENNFALFDVAYWARGVDIYAIVGNLREHVLDRPDIDVDEFYISLLSHFDALSPIAHFGIVSPDWHQTIINNPRAWERWFFSSSALERLRLDHVLGFYEPRYSSECEQTGLHDRIAWARFYQSGLMVSTLYRFALFGMQEQAERIRLAIAEEDFEEATQLISYALDISNSIPNVTTSIIEEGRIARLTVNSFFTYQERGVWREEREQIIGFLQDIHGFEHLIIDLRANSGGAPRHFFDSVISPLIDEALLIEGYAFFNYYGSYVQEYANSALNQWEVGAMVPDFDSLRPISEILGELELPRFNYDDADRLSHGFPLSVRISPGRFDMQFFDGEIWLLTGPFMTSASQVVPWVVEEIDFATLVGDVTGGVFGGTRTFVALPNSGIAFAMDMFYITDRHGFPLEAGTTPHYFSRDGMDALETALALIEERDVIDSR